MSDVELVIKISEETYKDIQSHNWKNGGRWYSEEWRAIHNGIPLPKRRRKLIDENEIIEVINGVFMDNEKYSPKAFLKVIAEQCLATIEAKDEEV